MAASWLPAPRQVPAPPYRSDDIGDGLLVTPSRREILDFDVEWLGPEQQCGARCHRAGDGQQHVWVRRQRTAMLEHAFQLATRSEVIFEHIGRGPGSAAANF